MKASRSPWLRSSMSRSSDALRLLTAVLASLVIAAQSGSAADSPTEVVRKLSGAVIAVLEQKDLSAEAMATQVRDIIYEHADFETISRLVLARNWSALDDAQKREFVEQFKTHLSITYGKSVKSYDAETVSIVGERDEGRGDWTVLTKNLRPGGKGDVLVDYRLRRKNGEWKVIDLLIDRVSLVSNFRSQFQEIIANGGIDHLLRVLRGKNTARTKLKS